MSTQSPESQIDQLELFDEAGFFLDAIIQGIDSKRVQRYAQHTGKTTLQRPKIILEISRMAAGGASNRAIARVLGLSRNTVQAVLETLESRGEVEPQKIRLLKVLRNLVHEGCCQLSEAIGDGLLPATQLSVPIGIMFDKMLLAEGSPTARVEHIRVEVSPDEVNAWLSSLPPAQVTAVRSLSDKVPNRLIDQVPDQPDEVTKTGSKEPETIHPVVNDYT